MSFLCHKNVRKLCVVCCDQELRNVRSEVEIVAVENKGEAGITAVRRGWIQKCKHFFRSNRSGKEESAADGQRDLPQIRCLPLPTQLK